jgi:antitoxin YqcF
MTILEIDGRKIYMSISPENKALAVCLKDAFDGRPSVVKFWDDAHQSSVDILCVEDALEGSVSAIGTLGLSDTPINLESGGKPLRVELLMAFKTDQRDGAKILSTCAFNVINSGMEIKLGLIFPRVIELYRPGSAMHHILFSSPYLWNLKTQDFPKKKVAWLQAIPISDAEREYALANGSDALETVLQEREANIFDFDRASTI